MSSNGNGTIAVAPFEPSRYLTKIGSADYLEVKWRLVWLRHDHADAVVETELVDHTQQAALFKARITIPGGGAATGFGSETPGDFRDYVEKAETKAIGRALAALGYGTQFCPDFEFGAAQGRVVDSPVSSRGGGQRPPEMLVNPNPMRQDAPPPQRSGGMAQPTITDAQNRLLHKKGQELFGDDAHQVLHDLVVLDYGADSVANLAKFKASQLIDMLLKQPNGDGIRQYLAEQRQPELSGASMGEPPF